MSVSREVVLLITHSGDFFTVDRVAESLVRLGAQPFRLDTDKFPGVVRLDLRIGDGGGSRIIYGENSIGIEQVRSVWMRRISSPELSKDLLPQFQAACVRESLATLEGLWDGLREAWWVDNLQRIGVAENKLRQLRVAEEIGLRIPRTLVTNNGEEVKQFFRVVGGRMVAKLLTPLSQSMQGSTFFLYTNAVKEEDLSDVGSLCHCPMVFQEQIPKLRELRVVLVNGKLFVGALDASLYADSIADWRQLDDSNFLWQPHELPAEIAHRLRIFMASFGLVFGAFDLIQTPSGEYVFLEVNPTGEWGMLERDLGYPISEAIARALLGVS